MHKTVCFVSPHIKLVLSHIAAEGWRSGADWANFGGQYHRDFLSGQLLGNSQFAEKMVKLGVGPHKEGGTHLMITPIINKYRAKK